MTGEQEQAGTATQPGGEPAYRRLRGWRAHRLRQELAKGEKTIAVLAREFGVAKSSISDFKAREKDAIAAIVAAAEDQYAGLWIAEKAARVAEYQSDVEELGSLPVVTPDVVRARGTALRAVAEELGQLKQQVTVQQTVHIVEGVDLKDLS